MVRRAVLRDCSLQRMGRDSSLAKRREAMGRRSSDEEKRDSSLRDPAPRNRAEEKSRVAPVGMTVGVGWCAVPRPHGLG